MDPTDARAAAREIERLRAELEASRAAQRTLADELQESRRVEEEARRARAGADAANRAKSTFLANMSHELRTPLNSILGFAQLMERDQSLSDQHRENLAVISKSGEHLLGLVNDILEMAKIEAGRITLAESAFDLHAMLAGLEEMFSVQATTKGLVLALERDLDVPRLVHGDEGKLRQVLINLLANALKFTSVGRVELRVRARTPVTGADARARVRLSFEVSDTGRGMAPSEVGGLFEAFAQGQGGLEAAEGTGLGLAISRQFVRLMGGDVRVESELGRGSTFGFDAWVSIADPRDVRGGAPERIVAGLAPGQPACRVLVADDRWETRHFLIKLLDAVGLDVRGATNGLGALAQWEAWEPHLVLMDMRMPVVDGYEATKQIKASPRGASTVVVAMTASAFDHNRASVLSAGCDDFLPKPFREADVFDMLTKHLGVRFVHERPQPSSRRPPPPPDAHLAHAAASLPEAWRADLRRAATRLDAKAIQAAIEQIRTKDAGLAGALGDLARSYRYDRILALSTADEKSP